MIAPCGVEIKVGQVWNQGFLDWEVQRVGHTGVELKSGDRRWWAEFHELTNKPGGYRLVQDVEQ